MERLGQLFQGVEVEAQLREAVLEAAELVRQQSQPVVAEVQKRQVPHLADLQQQKIAVFKQENLNGKLPLNLLYWHIKLYVAIFTHLMLCFAIQGGNSLNR